MRFDYKRITLKTNKDITIAENYLNKGWKIISFGFDTILFEKKRK